jgi:hypothetical protein
VNDPLKVDLDFMKSVGVWWPMLQLVATAGRA